MVGKALELNKPHKVKLEEKNNISVWGLGKHSIENLIPAIISNKSLRLYGVFSRNKKVVKKSCKIFDCSTWDSSEKMLADENLNTVLLATPTGLHYEQGLDILNAKKHLWCEKSFTTSLTKTEEIINLSRKLSLAVAEGYMYLYHPQFRNIKTKIFQNEIGEIISVNCKFGLPTLQNPGFRLNKDLGASCLLDVGCYPISLILHLLNPKKIEVLNSEIDFCDNDIDQGGFVLLKIDNSVTALLEWNYNKSYRNDVDIWGSDGSIKTYKIFSKKRNFRPSIFKYDLFGHFEETKVKECDHYELMFKEFDSIIHSSVKREKERNSIYERARLIDIIKRSLS